MAVGNSYMLLTVTSVACVSVTFWYWSGSAPLTNGFGSERDPAIFVCDLQETQEKFFTVFFLITIWRYIYIIFQTWKVIKKSQNSKNQGFSNLLLFLLDAIRMRVRIREAKTYRSGSATLTVSFVRTQEFYFFSLLPTGTYLTTFFFWLSKNCRVGSGFRRIRNCSASWICKKYLRIRNTVFFSSASLKWRSLCPDPIHIFLLRLNYFSPLKACAGTGTCVETVQNGGFVRCF